MDLPYLQMAAPLASLLVLYRLTDKQPIWVPLVATLVAASFAWLSVRATFPLTLNQEGASVIVVALIAVLAYWVYQYAVLRFGGDKA